MTEPDPLYVFDKAEFRDIARCADPALTDEEFDVLWEEFQRWKNLGWAA